MGNADKRDIVFMSMETTGLSPKKDTIITISVFEREYVQFFADDLKSEFKILKEFFDMADGKILITLSGDGFENRFLREKMKKYSISCDFCSISIRDMIGNFKNYLGISELNKRYLAKKYNLEIGELKPKELIELYQTHLMKDLSAKRKILNHSLLNLEFLVKLHEIISRQKETLLSFKAGDLNFLIDSLEIKNSSLVVRGRTDDSSEKYVPSKNFTLSISNNLFEAEIFAIRGMYDQKKSCLYVLESDFKVSKKQGFPKSPKSVIVLYVDDFLIENIIEILKTELS